MSYCRTGDGSDVYIYGSLNELVCHVAWRDAYKANVPDSLYVPWGDNDGTAQKTMLGHLYFLRSRNLKVPDHAIERLLQEISDLSPGTKTTAEDLEADALAWAVIDQEWKDLKP